MPRFSRSFVESVLAAQPIDAWVQRYLKLNYKGKDAFALCPFHSEKTPSFSLNLKQGFFYCFGCQKSGNAIDLIMHFENLSFQEAVLSMATQVGISPPEGSYQQDDNQVPAMKVLAALFQRQLKNNVAVIAFLKARGISGQTAKRYGLGFCDFSPDALLRVSQLDRDTLMRCDVLAQSSRGFYPRFRQRLMIPIHNTSGHIIGWGGRLLGPGEPKYLNSPESDHFKKAHTLYGLYQARAERVTTAILVEGYFDVMMLSQNGFHGALAPMGTSVTEGHIRLLARHFSKVIVCFDGDTAGQLASEKFLLKALSWLTDTLSFHFVVLPTDEDPDSLLHKQGPKVFETLLQQSCSLFDFICRRLLPRHMERSVMIQALAKIAPLLQKMPNSLSRHALIKDLGEYTHLGEGWLHAIHRPVEDKKTTPSPSSYRQLSATWYILMLKHADIKAHCQTLWQDLQTLLPRSEQVLWQMINEANTFDAITLACQAQAISVDYSLIKTLAQTDYPIEELKNILIKLTIHHLEPIISGLIGQLKVSQDDKVRERLLMYMKKKKDLQAMMTSVVSNTGE